MAVKLLKLVTAEEIVADITESENGNQITIDNPVMLRMMPQADGIAMGFMEWSHSSHKDEKFIINKCHVLYIHEPIDEVKNAYCTQFGKVIVPGNSHIKLS